MLLPAPPLYPRKRRRQPKAARYVVPVAPTLVSASLEGEGDVLVRLTFDRAVDVAGIVPAQVTVNDGGGTGLAYAGAGLDDTPSPEQLVLSLAETGPAAPGATTLSASGATGIVAVDGGAAWAGVTELELPFP